GGSFEVRPATRAELRAPVAGFLRQISFNEGDRVSPGALVARVEVPDLDSRLTQKRAEVREARAKLRMLEVGPRPQEVLAQRGRVERLKGLRDLAGRDLGRAGAALREELARLGEQVAQCEAEMGHAREALARAGRLRGQRAVSDDQCREAAKQL